jgi:hypothetical protein
MGHQAAQCKTGTIPWREVFGDEAFVVRKPVFWTEVLAKREAHKVDFDQLTKEAVAYAQASCESQVRSRNHMPSYLVTCTLSLRYLWLPLHSIFLLHCCKLVQSCFKGEGS